MFTIPNDLTSKNCIFVSVVGSHAQNSADARSDIDYHACYIEPTSQYVSLDKRITSVASDKEKSFNDYIGYEVEKYLRMILKSNCNALEDIHSPIMLHKHPVYFKPLKQIASECITKGMYHCYSGVSIGVKKRILSESYDERTFQKHHRNMFRNLFTGIHALETGEIIMDYEVLKDMFDYHEPEFAKWNRDFDRYMFDLDWAYNHSDLPDERDDEVEGIANEFLIKVRRENW